MRYEIFNPTARGAEKLIARARQRVAEMDVLDEGISLDAVGIDARPPHKCAIDLHLRTAISAIICGIEMRSFSTVAEGLVMLQDAELRVRMASQ